MTDPDDKPKYKAPALAKGIEILELLAHNSSPLTLSGISESIGRSRSEIFRMVQDLETMGYIRRSDKNEGYELTNRLFTLGLERPKVASVLEAALPEMRRYAGSALQSCHVATPFDGEFVVIARIESAGDMTFSVRVGHRRPLQQGTSGIVLYAFQPEDVQQKWEGFMAATGAPLDLDALRVEAERTRQQGYFSQSSSFVDGVTDIGAPILRGGRAVASLTSPCITKLSNKKKLALPKQELMDAAVRISAALTEN